MPICIENKFINIKVKCKCVLCALNFVEEREGKKNLWICYFIRLN